MTDSTTRKTYIDPKTTVDENGNVKVIHPKLAAIANMLRKFGISETMIQNLDTVYETLEQMI